MKRIVFGILLFSGVVSFCAADEKSEMSYAFGMIIAADLVETGFEFNYDTFIQGFRETMEKEKTRYTMNEAMEIIDAAFEAAHTKLGEQNRALGDAFLAENSKRKEVTVTSSGLQYEVVTEGSGDKPSVADVVLVHYRGATIDDAVFDSTYESGGPIEVPLDRVIPGWSEGLRMMREGGKAILYIPPNLAYGENGAGKAIGPNTVLVFDIDLLGIVRPPEGPPESPPPGEPDGE